MENFTVPPSNQSLHIAEVERETGLSKDLLRVWERRYGFPKPLRDANDERVYPVDQVQRLRTLKRLIDQGLRPRHIVGLPAEELARLASPTASERAANDASVLPAQLQVHWKAIKEHQAEQLKQALLRDLAKLGVMGFITDVVSPLNDAVGEGWVQGNIEVFEEHLYTETVQGVMRYAINNIQSNQESHRPVVLLTTLPSEPHSLGLLMAEAALSLSGARCVALGPQTPVHDIIRGAAAHKADIVALSFSTHPTAKSVHDGLAAVRAELPETVGIWVGGSHPALEHIRTAGIDSMNGLHDVDMSIQAWRDKPAA